MFRLNVASLLVIFMPLWIVFLLFNVEGRNEAKEVVFIWDLTNSVDVSAGQNAGAPIDSLPAKMPFWLANSPDSNINFYHGLHLILNVNRGYYELSPVSMIASQWSNFVFPTQPIRNYDPQYDMHWIGALPIRSVKHANAVLINVAAPEPSTYFILGSGIALFFWLARHRSTHTRHFP